MNDKLKKLPLTYRLKLNDIFYLGKNLLNHEFISKIG